MSQPVEQTSMRAVIEKAQRGETLTDFEMTLYRAAYALTWLAQRAP